MTRSPLISVSVSAAAAAVLMALAMPASAVDSEIYGAPGLVPHPVKDYLPITVNKNMCVMCHKEQKGRRPRQGRNSQVALHGIGQTCR